MHTDLLEYPRYPFFPPGTMTVDESKSVQVSASETGTSPSGSILGAADPERQKRNDGGYSTFEATEDYRFYRPIDSYEGIHRWDPEFEWTEKEEQKIVRKVGYSRGYQT